MKKIKICFYIGKKPDFKQCGGHIVIHHAIKLFNEVNIRTCLYSVKLDSVNPLNTPLGNRIDANTIVVYSEKIMGNPLKANIVARWLLYDPYIRGGHKLINSWNKKDVIISYGNYIPYKSDLKLSVCKFDEGIFIFDKSIKKTKKYYIIHKALISGWTKEFLNKQIIYLKTLGFDELGSNLNNNSIYEKLSETSILVSFDVNTYYSNIAVLCGCLSIIYKGNECKKSYEEILNQRGVYGSIGLKPYNINILEQEYNYTNRMNDNKLYRNYIANSNNIKDFISYFKIK